MLPLTFSGQQSRRHPEVQPRWGAQLEGLRRAAGPRWAQTHPPQIRRSNAQPQLWWTALINIPLSTAKINEDNFGPEDDEIQFDDCGYGDDDDVDEVSSFDLSCPGPFDVWV